jgi:hypothetical protein
MFNYSALPRRVLFEQDNIFLCDVRHLYYFGARKKPNPSRDGDGKPRVLNRQPGCLTGRLGFFVSPFLEKAVDHEKASNLPHEIE